MNVPVHSALDTPPEVSLPSGSAEEHTEVARRVERFVADLNSHDLERIGAWFTETSTILIPPARMRTGVKRIVRAFNVFFVQYDELHWSIERTSVQSNTRAFSEVRSWGRFRNGRRYENRVLSIHEFTARGHIQQLVDYFADTAIFGAQGIGER